MPAKSPASLVTRKGAALILELQRLRQAFERDGWSEAQTPPQRRSPPKDARSADSPRRRAPKKRAKRGVGRDAFRWPLPRSD